MHPDEAVLNDLADETLDASERSDVERHLRDCAQCRALVDDLREIRRVAGSLELREPPFRAWTRIERAIRFEAAAKTSDAAGADGRSGDGPAEGGRFARKWTWLAAAAVLVLATVVGLRFGPSASQSTQTNAPSDASESAASSEAAAQAVEAELRQAEAHYVKAIQGLEQIANAEQGALDPRTAATVQKNLSVIDHAISESRAALREQPTSEPALQSLIDNFKTKMGLLQDTVALINEMRKGNEAGAARIVSGLKQKGAD